MPPPHPWKCPAKSPTPVAYVPNAPISNSLALKNSGGGGGGGAITCFEDTTGSPANTAIAWEARATTVKVIIFFIFILVSRHIVVMHHAGRKNRSCKAFL